MPLTTSEPSGTIVKKLEPVQTVTTSVSIVKLAELSKEPAQTVKLLEVVPTSVTPVLSNLTQLSNTPFSTNVTLTSVPSIKSIKRNDFLFNQFIETEKPVNDQKSFRDLPKIYELPNEDEDKDKTIKSIIKKKHSIKPKDEEYKDVSQIGNREFLFCNCFARKCCNACKCLETMWACPIWFWALYLMFLGAIIGVSAWLMYRSPKINSDMKTDVYVYDSQTIYSYYNITIHRYINDLNCTNVTTFYTVDASSSQNDCSGNAWWKDCTNTTYNYTVLTVFCYQNLTQTYVNYTRYLSSNTQFYNFTNNALQTINSPLMIFGIVSFLNFDFIKDFYFSFEEILREIYWLNMKFHYFSSFYFNKIK